MYKQQEDMKKCVSLQRGQAFILTILALILTSSGVISAMLFPVVTDMSSARETSLGGRSYAVAESLVEDLTYRIRNGMPTGSTESLTIDGDTAQADITSNGPFGEIVTVEGNADGRIRKIQATLNAGDGATFNYGVQAGNGGFYLSNNSGVEGNVYSNGDIICFNFSNFNTLTTQRRINNNGSSGTHLPFDLFTESILTFPQIVILLGLLDCLFCSRGDS